MGAVFGPRTEPLGSGALAGQASRYFAALDSSVGDLRQRAQRLIDRVNESRKEDHSVLSGFRDSLLLKVRVCVCVCGGLRLIALFRPN